jgi:hypothetical protein
VIGLNGQGKGKEAVLFLKKKNQKNFSHLALAVHPARAKWTKVFCFFFSKKKALACFLATAR